MSPPHSPGNDRVYFHLFTGTEIMAAGIGCVLVCIGIVSGYRLLTLIGVVSCIGAIINAVRHNRVGEKQLTHKEDTTLNTKKLLVFDDNGFGGSIEVEENDHEKQAYTTLKKSLLVPGVPASREVPLKPAARKPEVEKRTPHQTYSAADFADVPQQGKLEPKNEFNQLLEKTLRVIKDICFAHTSAFFWINRDTRQLVVECKVTDSEDFTTERKIPIGNDVISTVALSGQPALLNHIAPGAEHDITCYYNTTQGVNSVVCVPVFYANDSTAVRPIAVIAIDSKATDAYGIETFRQMTHFTKMISSLLQSYTEKYDYVTDLKTMDADRCIKTVATSRPGSSAVVNAFMEEASNLVPWDTMTTVLFDVGQRKWVIVSARSRANERFVLSKQAIDLSASVTGMTIETNRMQSLGNIAESSYQFFHEHEVGMDFLQSGSFLAIPLSSGAKCFGAVTFGSRTRQTYGKKEISCLQYLSTTLVMALDADDLGTIVRDHSMIDSGTGVGTQKYFLQRLAEEVARSTDTGEDLSVVLVALSPLNEVRQRFGDDAVGAALKCASSLLRSSVHSYDVVARYDDGSFGVLLSGTVANEAFLWAEKIRSKIAGTVIDAAEKQFSITVTISICGVIDEASGRDSISHAEKVMRQAQAAGGNMVRVY